jgi:alcohol dehydrogenase class IV
VSLGNILADRGYKNIFLVTNNDSYFSSGNNKLLETVLIKGNCNFYRHYGFEVNPKIEDVQKGIDEFQSATFDAIIAIGGGSAMDMAKLIKTLYLAKGTLVDCVKNNQLPDESPIPLIAIPTTSGSGSEATQFAVVYIEKQKFSLVHDSALPDIAIIDPIFTYNLPATVTAYTGMDALCQAVESYWSVASTDESKKHSAKAISLILDHLANAVNHPDLPSRQAMAEAAYFAGCAINITKTTAPHALSYPITTYYNVPHGHAVALTLGIFLVHNYALTDADLNDIRGVSYVKKSLDQLCNIFQTDNPQSASESIQQLMHNIGLETSFCKLGIDDISLIVNKVNPARLQNNPRQVSINDITLILQSL